jgi:uncharacterized protein (DUF1499 family)
MTKTPKSLNQGPIIPQNRGYVGESFFRGFPVSWSLAGVYTAAAAVLLLLLGPLGTRAGLWSFLVGFALLGLGALAGVAAVVTAAIGLGRAPNGLTLAGGVLALAVLATLAWQVAPAFRAPAIHDLTTDVGEPPPFEAVLPLRAGAANPPGYDAGVAAVQREAYPDIQPLMLQVPPQRAFDRALAAATQLGWQIVARDPARGRIEAVDTTFWFGFKDDIVVRIRETGDGSRVDVRSKSRVGRGDVGANARRIRAFLSRVRT